MDPFELTRQGKYSIALKESRKYDLSVQSAVYCLASSYYGAQKHTSNSATTRFIQKWKSRWYMLAGVIKSELFALKNPMETMTLAQIDARANIMSSCLRFNATEKLLLTTLQRKQISDDEKASLLLRLGKVYDKLKRYANGKQAYEKGLLLAQDPYTKSRVWKEYGIHFMRMNQKKNALATLKKAKAYAHTHAILDQEKKCEALLKMAYDNKLHFFYT